LKMIGGGMRVHSRAHIALRAPWAPHAAVN
jgi:hypothetical protein